MAGLSRLIAFIRPHLGRMALAASLLAGVAGTNLLLIWIGRSWFDAIFLRRDSPGAGAEMDRITLLLAALFLLQGLLSMGHSYLTAALGQRVMADLRVRLLEHLERLSLSFFTARRTGELMSRLTNDVAVIQHIATSAPVDLPKQLVTLAGGVGLLFYMNWHLGVLILVFLPILLLTARLFGRRLRRLSTEIQDQMADASTVLEEVLSSIRIVKSFVREAYERQRYAEQVERTIGVAMRRAGILAVFLAVITVLTFWAAAAVAWYAGRQILAGAVSPGDFFAFLLYGGILIGPFASLARLFTQMKEAQGATQRIFEILDTRPEVGDLPEARPLPPIRGRVVFHHVGFAYTPGVPVLRAVAFEALPGEAVALVGPSGGGKTTLIHLLHRFYDPTEGWIEIDGQDIRQVQLASLYGQIGLVPQETILFGGTIRENIWYGRLEASEAEIVASAKAANAHDFIVAAPKGYDTVVGEKGILLSAGQRQRIAIARAILKNPQLLILDEATSALDNESETLVQEALQRLMNGRTTFIIAHRLTTIQRADRILVLDRGHIVEQGSHQALLEQKGLYHHLYTLKLAGVEA